MGEQKREIIRAVVFALILVVVLAGASYYLLPPEAISPPFPHPTGTPAPQPTPFHPIIEVEVVSLEGVSYTEMGYAFPEKVPVLQQGTSANITLNVYSQYNESCDVSLSFYYSGGESSDGVNYRFYPSTLELPPEGMATSTLTLEAVSDAPSNLIYDPRLGIQVEGFPDSLGQDLGFNILVFPTTPSYIFYVFARELPTPTQPPPTNETTPPPHPTPMPTPSPAPPWEPEIQLKRGGEVQILFYIHTKFEYPAFTLNVTYQSGELPEGINADITLDPLKPDQNSLTVSARSLLLTITANSQAPEETYEITANGGVYSITFERKIHLEVTS